MIRLIEPVRSLAGSSYLDGVCPKTPTATSARRANCFRILKGGFSSKHVAKSKLQLPIRSESAGRSDCAQRLSEVGRRRNVAARIRKLRCVEDVERLSTELYAVTFRDREALKQRKVEIDGTRSVQDIPSQVSDSSHRRWRECRKVQLICGFSVVCRTHRHAGQQIRSRRNGSNLQRITAARHSRQWKSRPHDSNAIHLPAAPDHLRNSCQGRNRVHVV